MRVLAIVPAYNEVSIVATVVGAIRATAPACDVCVIDDGSSDATAVVAAAAGAKVLRCPVNLGIGGAVQTAYLWARERGYDAAVQIDADGQHDPRFLQALLEPLANGTADLVIGSRFLDDNDGYRSTGLRRVGIRYLTWLLRMRCGARVTDPTSGFRAAGRRAIELFARHYPSDYPEPEAIALSRRAGLRLSEVPVRMASRSAGKSTITPLRTIYYLVKVSIALVMLPSRAVSSASRG